MLLATHCQYCAQQSGGQVWGTGAGSGTATGEAAMEEAIARKAETRAKILVCILGIFVVSFLKKEEK